jgi:hypothetical protein
MKFYTQFRSKKIPEASFSVARIIDAIERMNAGIIPHCLTQSNMELVIIPISG